MHLYFHNKMSRLPSEFSQPPTEKTRVHIGNYFKNWRFKCTIILDLIYPSILIYLALTSPDLQTKSNFLLHISTGSLMGISSLTCPKPMLGTSNFLSNSHLPCNNLHHHSPTSPGQISRNHPSFPNSFTCNQFFRSLTGAIFKTSWICPLVSTSTATTWVMSKTS